MMKFPNLEPSQIQAADILFNFVVIMTLIITLTVMGLALRRVTKLGTAMSRFNFIIAAAYGFALLGMFFDVIAGLFIIRWMIRLCVLITTLEVVWRLKELHGSWGSLGNEIWTSFTEMFPCSVLGPLRDRCRDNIRRTYFKIVKIVRRR